MDDNSKRYDNLENTLQRIHEKYISLSDKEMKRNNVILKKVLNHMVQEMQEKSKLFKSLFREIFFGGSYYDGLKVGSPNEYDIDLLLRFPDTAKPVVETSEKPGYVRVYLQDSIDFETLCEEGKKRYVNNEKVIKWIQSVVQLVLNDFEYSDSWYMINPICGEDLKMKTTRAGPAFTLHLRGTIDTNPVDMDIDLVTCFKFGADMWPNGFKENPCSEAYLGDFFVVPKPPKVDSYKGRYWRLSFQQQERNLIIGKERFKSAIRFLKKMRTVLDHKKISSYYIKTVALWETEEKHDWDSYSLSYTFMLVTYLCYYVVM
ncbi:hypothetical protein NQ317_013951 [Molorchus minor]|uniref:Mab-21-like nucleotidyltransferase domain-containing protein n=1 Tax=Molorchus minor TaxID=1323400 RepID=A0ABQ9JWF7_9CUCU|nr:hypothetical protein NQ317_013951 [Molorchus minor]